MHRWLVVLSTLLVAAASVTAVAMVSAPRAWSGDAPIGHIGDTLRVDTGTYIADVTVSSVAPCDPPPGFGYTREGVPVKSFPGSTVDRAESSVVFPNADGLSFQQVIQCFVIARLANQHGIGFQAHTVKGIGKINIRNLLLKIFYGKLVVVFYRVAEVGQLARGGFSSLLQHAFTTPKNRSIRI